jgi:carbon monoxide dehydrogenase subunit G
MEFDNSFEVPLPVDETWKLLMDIRRIAPCLPGAELTEVVDERTYKGKVGVRLGPVSLAFAGTVKFDEIDDAAHRAKISAQGSDAKGRGGANATATFHLEPVTGGSKVLVHTNLTLSGAVAQYGRGVGIIQVTAAQIITQFANNLKAQFAPAPAVASASAAAPTPAPPTAAVSVPLAAPATQTATAAASSPPLAAAKPISGFALAGAVFVAWLKRLFGRG